MYLGWRILWIRFISWSIYILFGGLNRFKYLLSRLDAVGFGHRYLKGHFTIEGGEIIPIGDGIRLYHEFILH